MTNLARTIAAVTLVLLAAYILTMPFNKTELIFAIFGAMIAVTTLFSVGVYFLIDAIRDYLAR